MKDQTRRSVRVPCRCSSQGVKCPSYSGRLGVVGAVGVVRGEAEHDPISDEACSPRRETTDTGSGLLGAALTRENLQRAFKRVRANKGAAGVDGLDIYQTALLLKTQWPVIREQLLSGTHRPSPVRRVTILKPDGSGERELGIPSITDRLIQQALLQVLQAILDPHLQRALATAFDQDEVRMTRYWPPKRTCSQGGGRQVVVDVDLEKFFDRINHDILIDRLQKRIADAGVIRLIRAYLNSAIMSNGVVLERDQGTAAGRAAEPASG